MIRALLHLFIFALLTMLTQIGGAAWVLALCFKHRMLAFAACYIALSIGALWLAPVFGRVPLPCIGQSAMQMHSPLYCALNRQYVAPELAEVLTDYAADMDSTFPDTQTRVLDANFPFITGFPLLPHLSHHDGRKVDLAFYYSDDQGYLAGVTRSPLGYFAFEDGPTNCPKKTLTLRWDMAWLQSLWPDYRLETRRMTAALDWLAADPRVSKIFIEPHLKQSLAPDHAKIRFQGCRAARHDDHIHIQL